MITLVKSVPIFGRAVVFVGDCTADQAEKKIYKLSKKRTLIDFTHTAAGSVREDNGDVFVWVKDLDKASVVAHELAHVACSIMSICGIPQCEETEEVLCYLIGWLKINVQDDVYEKREAKMNREKGV